MKPVIGITCNYDYKDVVGTATGFGGPLQDWDYIALDYANAVVKAGGIPVIIPNLKKPEEIRGLIERLDGVIMSGGSDVDPRVYGEEPNGYCGVVFTRRDRQEKEVLLAAYEAKLPILGICRGVQFMTAVFGGKLYQDVPHELGVHHTSMVYSRNEAAHQVNIEEGSLLHDIFGTTQIGVNSYHHQSVKTVSENGKVVARSTDGIVEAVEFSGGHPFTLGVQWHPEMMYDSAEQQKLFDAFIKVCSE